MAALRLSPPQPTFRCGGCSVSFRVATMRSVVYSSLSTSSQLSPIKENLKFPELLRKFQLHIRKIYKHLNMVQRLTSEIAAARSEIEQLHVINAQFQSQLNKDHVSFSQSEPFLAATSQLSLNFPWHNTTSTPWRNSEWLQHMKEDLLQMQQQSRQQHQETVASLLQPTSANQGF